MSSSAPVGWPARPLWLKRAGERVWAPGSPWPAIAVAAAALLPHLGALRLPFVYDDWSQILENPFLRQSGAIRRIFAGNVWEFVGRAGISNFYRPLMHVWYYLLYQAFGPHPAWFHLADLLLHAGVSLLVLAVVTRVVAGLRPAGRAGAPDATPVVTGTLAALLFAVYPLHAEVIAWVACAPELLCAFFSLAAILLYLRSGETGGRKRALHAVATGMALLLAALSKEIALAVPLFLLAYEWVARRSRRPQSTIPSPKPARKMTLDFVLWTSDRHWPEWLALGAAVGVYLAARIQALGGLMPYQQQIQLTWGTRLWTAMALFYRYAALAAWPFSLNFFRYLRLSTGPFEPAVLAGVVAVAAFVLLAAWLYRRRAPELLALALYLLALAPMFQLPYAATGLLMTERAAYLPSVGVCWLLAAVVMRVRGPWSVVRGFRRRVAWVLVVLLVGTFAARSVARMNDWRDEIALFDEGVAVAPWSYHLYSFKGEMLLRHNQPAQAVAALEQSLKLREDFDNTHNFLGRAYSLLDQDGLAMQHYLRAAQLAVEGGRPYAAAPVWNNIGVVLRSEGRTAEAIAAYRRALEFDPQFAAARNNLGFVLLLENRVAEAIEQLQQAVAQNPAMVQAQANLGLAYALSGDLDAAWAALSQAQRLDPENAEVQARMGEVCLARGQTGAAREHFLRALARQPGNARARSGLAALGEETPNNPPETGGRR
jgi:tetratricopeptide (TPR) repeat protein